MKFKIPINYDIPNQKEVVAQVSIPAPKVREIVADFFNRKKYEERRDWFKKNLTEIDVILLNEPEEVFPAFKNAYQRDGSSLIIEWGKLS